MAENYASAIKRADLGEALIPKEVSTEIIQTLPERSLVASRAKHMTMSRARKTQPVLAELPDAYWVTEGGLKQTTKTGWEDVTITAEELAVLVPIPDSVVEDADINIWAATVSVTALAMFMSLLTSIAGLPEVDGGRAFPSSSVTPNASAPSGRPPTGWIPTTVNSTTDTPTGTRIAPPFSDNRENGWALFLCDMPWVSDEAGRNTKQRAFSAIVTQCYHEAMQRKNREARIVGIPREKGRADRI